MSNHLCNTVKKIKNKICLLSAFQKYDIKYYKVDAAYDCLLLTGTMLTPVQAQQYI